MSESAKVSFVKGAAVLAAAGLIARFLGLFYRIVITRAIGTEGVGLYQLTYPFYTILLVVAVSGVPVALGKIISEKIALGEWASAYRVFKIARNLSAGFGMAATVFLIIAAKPLIAILKLDERVYISIIAIAPAIFIVSVMAAYRGFFHGMQNMFPTAYSQVVEQIVRMGTIVLAAYLLSPYGIKWAAAGATFSAVTGAIAGYLVVIIPYRRQRKEIEAELKNSHFTPEPIKAVIRQIGEYALPVIIAASILQLMSVIGVFIPQRLQSIGYSVNKATELYGELTGVAMVLVNFPQIITTSLQTSLIPSISSAFALGLTDTIKSRTYQALRYAIIIGLASAAGLYVLAEPLCRIVFDAPNAAGILRILTWGVIFISIQQITSGILQGAGLVKKSARNLLVGTGVSGILMYYLTAIPKFGIIGAAYGTVIGFAVAAFLNLTDLGRTVKYELKVREMLISPILATIVMSGIVHLIYRNFTQLLRGIFAGEVFAIALATGLGGVIFLLALIITGGMAEPDLQTLPGMKRLIPPLKRLGLL